MSKPWTPRPYMMEAVEFGVTRGCAGLMLDPGLGKTSISLAIVAACIAAEDVDGILVVAPLRVAKTTWPAEAREWEDFSHLVVKHLCEMDDADRVKALKSKVADIYVINPESLHRILDHKDFDSFGLNMIIIDESTKFKDTQTKRFKSLKKRLHHFKRRLILTGTPVPNGLADLFGQIYILDEGEALGRYITHFRMEFMYQKPGDMYSYHIRPGADKDIYERVKPLVMRLQAKDHLDMPELINNYIEVDLPKRLVPKYKELDDNFLTIIDEEVIMTPTSAAAGAKCRQFANGFVYVTEPDPVSERMVRRSIDLHDEKVDALEQLVEEMQGRPLLVGYEFQEDAEKIMRRFPDAVNLGKVKNVEAVIAKFNAGEIPLLLAHPASAGHGLNLQKCCNTVCWYGIPWDLELYQQFIARVWRQGQPSDIVVVHHIVCRGTRDQKVVKVLSAKDATQEDFNLAVKSSL